MGLYTVAWVACPPPQENLTQRNLVSLFLPLNKNLYNKNMAKLIFYVHVHLLLDRGKLRAVEACTDARTSIQTDSLSLSRLSH